MTAAHSINLRVNAAEQFKESVSEPEPNTKLFLTFGKILPWANDLSPDQANSSVSTAYEVWRNMIGAKRVTNYDIRHAIPRYNWEANTKYIAYDNLNANLHADNVKFYVINSDYSIYKCIANNSGANSTVEPTSINPNILSKTTDGYIWKYMYTLNDADKLRFVTDNYIPVSTLSADDGSLQWDVQAAAVEGEINSIVIQNAGTGYNSAPTLTISGDGVGATAVATVNTSSNTINSVSIITPGTGYSYATVSVSHAYGIDASLRPIISPRGGHGSDALYELGGCNVLINPRLSNSEGGVFPVTNDFRQIAIIKDPTLYDSNVIPSNSVFSQTMDIVVNGSGPDYITDEIVYQGTNLESATFSAVVLEYNSSANNLLRLTNMVGTPTNDGLIGQQSVANKFVVSVTYPGLKPYSGRLLYVDNIQPISRDSSQTEDVKILFKF